MKHLQNQLHYVGYINNRKPFMTRAYDKEDFVPVRWINMTNSPTCVIRRITDYNQQGEHNSTDYNLALKY